MGAEWGLSSVALEGDSCSPFEACVESWLIDNCITKYFYKLGIFLSLFSPTTILFGHFGKQYLVEYSHFSDLVSEKLLDWQRHTNVARKSWISYCETFWKQKHPYGYVGLCNTKLAKSPIPVMATVTNYANRKQWSNFLLRQEENCGHTITEPFCLIPTYKSTAKQ